MTSWHAQNHFLSGGFKFSLASVKNNHNYKDKYFECVFGCMVRNITGRATTPDTTVPFDQVVFAVCHLARFLGWVVLTHFILS